MSNARRSSRSGMPVNALLLVGPTGSGKSPLGDEIARNGLFGRRCHHLDFGSELRAALRAGPAAYSSAELEFIRGVLEDGLLLENEQFVLAEKIVGLFLDNAGFNNNDVLVLNGIPRHAGQARDMASIADILGLIVLECSAEEVVCRIRNNAGGDRTGRIDDEVDLIKKKLLIYRERTAPLIDHYEQRGRNIYRLPVTGSMTPAEAYQAVSRLAAAHPPLTLVAEPPER